MKKFVSVLLVSFVCATLLSIGGCGDPTKTGGGGQQQPYDSKTGQYK